MCVFRENVIMPEDTDKKEMGRCMFHQNDKWRKNWDLMIIFLASYNCLFLPVEFAFAPPLFEMLWNKILQAITDVIFFIDIPITFRTTYTSKGAEVIDPKKIAKKYIKTQLIVDVVSCIPFDNIGEALSVTDPTTL